MNEPLVSVITICKNCKDDLLLTSKSVAEQHDCPMEYIVIDGGSSDGTKSMLADGTVSATRYKSEPDRGLYDAMNKGAHTAKGEWLIFMNAGDTFASSDTLALLEPILRETKADVIYGDALLSGGGELTRKCGLEPANRHRMYFHHQAAFIRRQLQLEIPYRLDVGLSGDYCFFKEAWIAGKKFEHFSHDVCIYDCNGISSRNRMRVISDNVKVIRRFDKSADKLKFLPRLYFVLFWNRIRGKK